jgi:hypothetical protein
MSWHIDSETLERYATGTATSAAAASAEAHLTGCAECRALARARRAGPRWTRSGRRWTGRSTCRPGRWPSGC